jgi:hypothetical protein
MASITCMISLCGCSTAQDASRKDAADKHSKPDCRRELTGEDRLAVAAALLSAEQVCTGDGSTDDVSVVVHAPVYSEVFIFPYRRPLPSDV